MRFSANCGFLWPDRPLLARLEAAARAGFAAVELHWPYDVPVEELAATLSRLGLEVVSLNTPRGEVARGDFGLAALPGREAESDAGFALALDYAEGIGASAIHVMAGNEPEADAKARACFLAALRRYAPVAAARGKRLLIEPLNHRDAPGYHLRRIEDAAAIVEAIGVPNLKIMADVYHLAIEGGDVSRRLEKFLPLIGHIQIAAVPDRGEPDSGEIDYRYILTLLATLDWQGPIGAEYRPRGDTDAGLIWRERLAG